jgi:hypothetical protein
VPPFSDGVEPVEEHAVAASTSVNAVEQTARRRVMRFTAASERGLSRNQRERAISGAVTAATAHR